MLQDCEAFVKSAPILQDCQLFKALAKEFVVALDASQDNVATRPKDRCKFGKYVGLPLGNQCKIEDIACGEFCPAMPDFFGDDLTAAFDQETRAEYVLFAGRCRSQRSRDDEINFAFREAQLYEIRVFRVVSCQSFRGWAESRREIPQKLGIVYEDVYVLTQAMTMPAHQYRAATKRPSFHGNPPLAGVPDQLECATKEDLPCP